MNFFHTPNFIFQISNLGVQILLANIKLVLIKSLHFAYLVEVPLFVSCHCVHFTPQNASFVFQNFVTSNQLLNFVLKPFDYFCVFSLFLIISTHFLPLTFMNLPDLLISFYYLILKLSFFLFKC